MLAGTVDGGPFTPVVGLLDPYGGRTLVPGCQQEPVSTVPGLRFVHPLPVLSNDPRASSYPWLAQLLAIYLD